MHNAMNAVSKCLPTSSVHITFESSRDHTRNAVVKPCLSEQLVISLLVEEQLMMATQSRVDLTVTIQIRRMIPAAMTVMQEQDHALANVDKYANASATPVFLLAVFCYRKNRDDLLLAMLEATAFVAIRHAATSLTAEDLSAEKTDGGISDFLASSRTTSLDGLFRQSIVMLW